MSLEIKANPIDGVVVRMGGRDYLVPPLSVGQVRRLESTIAELGEVNPASAGQVSQGALDVIRAAMSRNYPGITVEDLDELVDLGNMLDTIQAIMGVSGLEKTSGEAFAGSKQTGPASTGA